jgi:two-component system OmpR family sensor kinase
VRLLQTDDDLKLTVIDSGKGMSEDFLAVAFDRFTRETASRPRPTGGSGLGLAIVRATVTRSGGVARIEPRPDGGTRVTVTLPLLGG